MSRLETIADDIAFDIVRYVSELVGEQKKAVDVVMDDYVIESLGLDYIVPDVYRLSNLSICHFEFNITKTITGEMRGSITMTNGRIIVYLDMQYALLFMCGIDITTFVDNLVAIFKQ